MSARLLGVLDTLLVMSLWEPTRAISLPGYEDERSIHICKTEKYNLECELGTFIWTRNVFVGVSSAHARDATTGAVSCPMATSNDCIKAVQRYYAATTYRRYNNLIVPDEMVMCDGVETAANYVHISYSCIDSTLLGPQNMCSPSSRWFHRRHAGYIITPGFFVVPKEVLYDCTCHLRPQVARPAGMAVNIHLMYANLLEPQECATETWVEDQDGQRISLGQDGLCSPNMYMNLSNQAQVQSLTLRFVQTRRDYTGNHRLKVLYGFEADTHMQVTCGPTKLHPVNGPIPPETSVPSTTTSTTRQEVSTTNLQPVTGPTPPETQLFGLGLDTVANISAIMGCSIVIIVVVVVTVRCSIRSRSTTPSSPYDITVHYDRDARVDNIADIDLTPNTEPFGGQRPQQSPPQGETIYENDSPHFDYNEKNNDYSTIGNPYLVVS